MSVKLKAHNFQITMETEHEAHSKGPPYIQDCNTVKLLYVTNAYK